MVKSLSERVPKARVVRLGGREIIVAEGQHLNFWADISHRCMTASWPSFIGGAALVFVVFNAIFAGFYWIAEDRKSTRLNSSHQIISYAVFCLKKKKCAGSG